MEDKLHIQLASLEGELIKLKSSVEYIEAAKVSVESAEKIIEGAKNLQAKVEDHAKLIEELIKKIDKVDFPSRLDKIDTSVATINQNISNLQTRMEVIDKSIKDDLKNHSVHLLKEIENHSTKQQSLLNIINKKNNLVTILTIVSILLIVVLGILLKTNII